MMRIDEISKAAAYNKPVPKYASAPEMLLYLSLKALYAEFKKGYISKADAADTKAQIVAKCEEHDKMHSAWCSDHKERQEYIRKAGTLLSDIEKEQDIKSAAFIAFEVIGRMTGDENFIKRQRKKWEKE
jgi:hypothetical protein